MNEWKMTVNPFSKRNLNNLVEKYDNYENNIGKGIILKSTECGPENNIVSDNNIKYIG